MHEKPTGDTHTWDPQCRKTDPPDADIAALATFLPVAAPTATQTAAATKALIRVLANYANVVTAQRATINVLADTIRFMLQR